MNGAPWLLLQRGRSRSQTQVTAPSWDRWGCRRTVVVAPGPQGTRHTVRGIRPQRGSAREEQIPCDAGEYFVEGIPVLGAYLEGGASENPWDSVELWMGYETDRIGSEYFGFDTLYRMETGLTGPGVRRL
jgi:hypothetical protein